ncbi:nucleoside triphosphate pyrophosphohydrolase [Bacillus sp. FJAT-45066]|uniref:nucleoside triphosphate pyrophosphohydrolase n=1 Tax=Bacillus sp. FJAT-45066 TaxID=2011010 RepID=UPI000BB6DC37|nr:nucleoside triphosphate pyrophosphohydrolase [Bacillus sp. FJAT-45066]
MKQITVIGLGAGDLEQLPLGIYKILKASTRLFLRTKDHPVVRTLEEEGITYESFDSIYEMHDSFEKVYDNIVNLLLDLSAQGPLIYAVPGHPLVAEKTVQLLLELERNGRVELEIKGGQSFLDPLFTAVGLDPIDGFQLLDGTSLLKEEIQPTQALIIGQVYDAFIASEVKLTLMEIYPDDFEVKLVTAAGTKEEAVQSVPLYELDRVTSLNNLTSVYVPRVEDEKILYKQFSSFRQTIATLRGPNGCPWDQKQTHESLKRYLIEETYELLDAINNEDVDGMMEELGDVLLQVLLHAQIGEDEGYFSIDDVIETINEKMVRRHPHVFGDITVENDEEVVSNWEEIKKVEKAERQDESLLDSVARSLPALSRALHLQKKAGKVGFDWQDDAPMWAKIEEEILELKEELKNNSDEKLVMVEFGDLLFAFVNIARFYAIEPEDALHATNEKFYKRFCYIEDKVRNKGKVMTDLSLEELDAIWEEAKREGL